MAKPFTAAALAEKLCYVVREHRARAAG